MIFLIAISKKLLILTNGMKIEIVLKSKIMKISNLVLASMTAMCLVASCSNKKIPKNLKTSNTGLKQDSIKSVNDSIQNSIQNCPACGMG